MKKKVLMLLLAFACVTAASAPLCAYASEYEDEAPAAAPAEEEEYAPEYTHPPHELSYIYVYSMPYKTTYTVGNSLYTEGLAITLGYADGEESVEWSGFNCYPYTLEHPGSQWIEVEYAGLYTGFYVNVIGDAELSDVEIYQLPDKLEYMLGDTLDMTGLKIRITYSDGKSLVTSNGFTCTPATLKTAGTQTIRLSYEGITISFDVHVTDPDRPTRILAEKLPDKTEYTVGDVPDLSGMQLKVCIGNGDEILDAVSSSRVSVEPARFEKAGICYVKVTYEDGVELSCEFPVQVTERETPENGQETPENAAPDKVGSGLWPVFAAAAAIAAYAAYIMKTYKEQLCGKSVKEILLLERAWRENRKNAEDNEGKDDGRTLP